MESTTEKSAAERATPAAQAAPTGHAVPAARVALVRCLTYQSPELEDSIERAVGLLGGWDRFVSPGQRVLLKVNMLSPKPPERAITTQPEIVAALSRRLSGMGCRVLVGDSPGGLNTAGMQRKSRRETGLERVCEETGAELVIFDNDVVQMENPTGKLYQRFRVGRAVAEADAIINLPRFKTHGLMALTAAVKNMFGAIPGAEKAQFHLKVPARPDFAEMLLDIYLCTKPVLNILDAVVAMDGPGPSAGHPKTLGALIAGADGPAVDAVAAALVGIDPLSIYTNKAAQARGLLDWPSGVEIAGDPLEDMIVTDFRLPTEEPDLGALLWAKSGWKGRLARLLRNRTSALPVLKDRSACTRCAICRTNCPAQAISLEPYPVYDYDLCIRCYCCQELCPEEAVALKVPLAARFLSRLR